MKKLFTLLALFFCACTSPDSKETLQIGDKNYTVISTQVLLKNQDRVDAVVYWHQRTDDAIIRVTHNNQRKEGKFFIPNLASGLSKLIKKRKKTLIMVLDQDMIQHSRTRTILNSLSANTKIYISFFPKPRNSGL